VRVHPELVLADDRVGPAVEAGGVLDDEYGVALLLGDGEVGAGLDDFAVL
jgi:hypothetical protein